MVLYLTENIIEEAVSGQQVVDALNNRTAVLINYADKEASHTGKRYIEPYVYGLTKAGNPCIRAYQYWGDTKRGVPKWKMFRLDRIESWEPTEEHFELEPQARGWAAQAYNNNDGSMSQVFQTVDLKDYNLMSDYEKLKAQTQTIKNSKPLNINNVNLSAQKPVKQQQNQTTSGPIQTSDTTPQQQVQNPIQNINKTESEPIQQNGDSNQSIRQNSPIKKEPQEEGPIVGDNTESNNVMDNPQKHSAEELMSNDDFRKMIQRNLEITNQEKQKRLAKQQNNLKK